MPPDSNLAAPLPVRPRSKSHNDYTVGWVCALSKELTAARAMLDQEDPPLSKPPNDTNTYVLGSIGEHNIVIACLPDGMIGTNQAAIIATRMISTFQAIKVGLMVGIGGGIPPKVKLGDIVVSRPTDQYPGVVQWDLGKMESGKFRRTGALNKPPQALLTALSMLKSEHDLHGIKIQQYLDQLEERYPHLAPKYRRPGPSKDSLPASNKTHHQSGVQSLLHSIFPWWGAEGTAGAVDFGAAEHETKDVDIHYGLVASGNQVIKDAVLRDRLNENLGGNVLCIEMEAAGLMDDFPCLVIRGVCDYADSEKNDEWQQYAAAIAAAYAKDFLRCLQPAAIANEPLMRDVLNQVRDNMVKVTSILENKDDLEILDWLTPIEYGPQHNDIAQKRQLGTGQWLLKHNKYDNWLQNSKKILFCPGMPGAGKTFLASIVVDHLFRLFNNTPEVGIAYIYFNYKRQDQQTIYNVLASILKQLAHRQCPVLTMVKTLYDQHRANKTKPSVGDITKALQFATTKYSRVFIIIDALDECQTSDYCRGNFLSEIFRLYTQCGINIFATSRHIQEIIAQFDLEGGKTLEIRAHEEDIRSYLDDQIKQSRRPILLDNCEVIKSEIARIVDGMFLLATFHFQSIKNKTTVTQLNEALESLATGPQGEMAYNLAYKGAMERIENQHPDFKSLADQVLSWVVCAERPLIKEELQHALAVKLEVDQLEIDKNNFTEVSDMISVCAGLVTIDKESNVVRLIHYTTQEYFNQAHKQWIYEAQGNIARVCATYLSFKTFDTGLIPTSASLYRYAAKNWGHHTRKSLVKTTQSSILSLLKNENIVSACSRVLVTRLWGDFDRYSATRMTGMHLAAYFGLSEYIDQLLRESADREARDKYGQTPLSLAAEKGHIDVVKLLLREGADRGARNKWGQTPLLLAVEEGHINVVKLLLREGADPEAENENG
ncbi:hypothetical protein TWF173_005234 [Orbilia oligospora]|nr:hypothetical protein TWF173_005234 [Orbilia oligospora]